MPYARVSTTERERALHELAHHLSVGRLSLTEFDERTAQAAAATTRTELAGLFADLPGQVPTPGIQEPPHPLTRLAVILTIVAICALAATMISGSWLWLLLIPAAPAVIAIVRWRQATHR